MSFEQYFHDRIRAQGYYVEKVEYDISFRQGSGSAFYGALGDQGLWQLCQRLLSGHEHFAAYRASRSITIRIDSNSNQYCHANTMSFDSDVECYYDPNDEMQSDLTELEYDSFIELMAVIEEDAKALAQTVHQEFEDLTLAHIRQPEIIFDFDTSRYRILVEKIEDEFFWNMI